METPPDSTATDGDVAKNQALMQRLLEKSPAELSAEISSLLGHTVTFSDMETSFITDKEAFHDDPVKRVIAELSFGTGDNKPGLGYLISPVRDAIELGGVLIMLSEKEVEKSVNEEDFHEDLKDAYGEIANVIAGFYSRVFGQRYTPAKTRVICKDISLVHTLEEEDVLAEQLYYCSSMSVSLKEKMLGRMQMLFPAVALKLSAAGFEGAEDAVDNGSGEAYFPLGEDLDWQQQKITAILEESCSRCQQEISALLSTDISLDNIDNIVISKADFFVKETTGKQIFSFIETKGDDVAGESFIVVDIKTAIHLGSVLVGLPPSESETVNGEEFAEDVAVAYGEIANTITAAYTSTFEEIYDKQLRFTCKDTIELTFPIVEPGAAEPFVCNDYFLSRMVLLIGGEEYGRLNLLFPLDVFYLQGLVYTGSDERDNDTGKEAVDEAYDVLLISDDEVGAGMIGKGFDSAGFSVKTISFSDEAIDFLGEQVRAVYLVVREVNEQAFGMAIKLSTISSLPIVAAAPAWTRSKVIKAVKYGIRDILAMPATDDEITKNIQKNVQ